MMKEIDDSSFASEVLKREGLVLVDFWALWCGPCKALSPIIEEIGKQYGDKISIFKYNVDNGNDVLTSYAIRSIPTLLFFKNGEVVDKSIGVVTKEVISNKIDQLL